MKSMSVREFEEYCSGLQAQFVFDSKNQNAMKNDYARIISRYDTAIISIVPNRLCFKQGNNMICFENVSYIDSEEHNGIGTFLTIHCGERNKNEEFVIFVSPRL